MKADKPTMEDVAKRAGVSAATVARVIYKNGYVKQGTRQVVENAIKATGYRPNVVARSLRTSRSFTLGLIVSEQRLSAFHPAVNHVIQAEAMKRGYAVLAFNSDGESSQEAAGVQRFLDHHVDAVIFCAAINSANVKLVVDSGIPAIQVERRLSGAGKAIFLDPLTGIRQAVGRLHGLGHRRFAYLGGISPSVTSDVSEYESSEVSRERSFIQALAEKGLIADEAHISQSPYFEINAEGRQKAYQDMRKMLQLPNRPTAVICGSDVLAASALQAVADSGLRVPHDLSVVGFDDTFARILTPALSSIAQPIEETGLVAVELALGDIATLSSDVAGPALETRYVERESTAPPSN